MVHAFLVRHGIPQFDPADRATMTLSNRGREQACLLGQYLAASCASVASFVCGTLERHRSTAACIAEAYGRGGGRLPDLAEDPRLNEMDDRALYQRFRGAMRSRPWLAEERERLESALADTGKQAAERSAAAAKLHDLNLLLANIMAVEWAADQAADGVDSYRAMASRIASWLADVSADGRDDHSLLVVSSRLPISLCVAHLRTTPPRQAVTLPLFHTSITQVCLAPDGSGTVLGCNRLPHLLARPDLWSQL